MYIKEEECIETSMRRYKNNLAAPASWFSHRHSLETCMHFNSRSPFDVYSTMITECIWVVPVYFQILRFARYIFKQLSLHDNLGKGYIVARPYESASFVCHSLLKHLTN